MLLITLYLPLALMIYNPLWYQLNCELIPKCVAATHFSASAASLDITAFFLHLDPLDAAPWTDKEMRHLAEVRGMYDAMGAVAAVAAVLLLALANRTALRAAAGWNIVVIAALLLVLPFFRTFWVDVFHPLLFDNELWSNTRADVSWYFMPKPLFRNSIVGLVVGGLVLNGLIRWRVSRRPPGRLFR